MSEHQKDEGRLRPTAMVANVLFDDPVEDLLIDAREWVASKRARVEDDTIWFDVAGFGHMPVFDKDDPGSGPLYVQYMGADGSWAAVYAPCCWDVAEIERRLIRDVTGVDSEFTIDDYGPVASPRPVAPLASTAGASAKQADLEVGTKVRLRRDVERYPHFIAPAGATGTVVDIGDDTIFAVRMDERIPGAGTWDNEVHWPDGMYGNPADDLEVLPRRTMVARFDVTGFSEQQAHTFAGYVEAQAEGERKSGDDATNYPSAGSTEITFDPPFPAAGPTRTVLVHLNVEVPADAPASADDIADEVLALIDAMADPDRTPGLSSSTEVRAPLAEEV